MTLLKYITRAIQVEIIFYFFSITNLTNCNKTVKLGNKRKAKGNKNCSAVVIFRRQPKWEEIIFPSSPVEDEAR